jgi:hypothetical protein
MSPAGAVRSSGLPGRLVASVRLSNVGNLGMTYLVTANWHVGLGVEVTRSLTRAVSPGTRAHALVTVPVTRAEVVANRALSPSRRCTTTVALVHVYTNTFQ